jgi:hypothetical protein
MATTFPTTVDNFTNPTIADYQNTVTVPHHTQHANLNDAIEAVEAVIFGIRNDLAASTIIPGATSWSVRNNGNTRDNLKVVDAGGVGIGGVASSNNALTVTSLPGTLTLGNILAEKRAFSIVMTTDWSDISDGSYFDLIDITHKSAGDAIFIAHIGGLKPGGNSTSGADAAVNILIPAYRDALGDGRTGGTVLNNFTGQHGLVIQYMSVVSGTAASIAYSGSDEMLFLNSQPSNDGPIGNGNAIWMVHRGTGHAIKIDHRDATAARTFNLVRYDNASGNAQWIALALDGEANQRFSMTYNGVMQWSQDGTSAPDAFLKYGTSAKQLTIQNELKINQGSGLSASRTLSFFTTGDAQISFQITGTGKHQWGDRTAALDTALYRSGVGALTTDGSLIVGGLLQTVLSATGGAGLNVPHGAAPSAPVNGDIWTTSAGGMFVRINGVTKSVNLT